MSARPSKLRWLPPDTASAMPLFPPDSLENAVNTDVLSDPSRQLADRTCFVGSSLQTLHCIIHRQSRPVYATAQGSKCCVSRSLRVVLSNARLSIHRVADREPGRATPLLLSAAVCRFCVEYLSRSAGVPAGVCCLDSPLGRQPCLAAFTALNLRSLQPIS